MNRAFVYPLRMATFARRKYTAPIQVLVTPKDRAAIVSICAYEGVSLASVIRDLVDDALPRRIELSHARRASPKEQQHEADRS